MSTLGELQSRYAQVRQEELNYWSNLQQTLRDIFGCLAVDLGLDPLNPLLMSLGIVNKEGIFRHASVEQITRNELSLEFALQIVLSQVENLIPPNLIRTEWSLRVTKNGIQLTPKGGRIISFEGADAAAKHINKVFEQTISSFSPYIR